MPRLIEVTQSNGRRFFSAGRYIGRAEDEKEYYTVMTEKHGKLYFDSHRCYKQWCAHGRKHRRDVDTFRMAHQTQKPAEEEQVVVAEDDEMMIVEEYTVEEYGVVE